MPNDAFASAILLTGANGTVTGTNVKATDQSASGEPAGENSVWYRWTPPSNGTAHFNIGMDWLENRRLYRDDDRRSSPASRRPAAVRAR